MMHVIKKGDRELHRKQTQALHEKRIQLVKKYRAMMKDQPFLDKCLIALKMRWEIWKLYGQRTPLFALNTNPMF